MAMTPSRLRSRLKAFPTPIGGLALGIGSLGIVLDAQLGAGGTIQYITALIAAGLLGVLALKFVSHPDSLWEDLQHPVVGSVVPTFAMGVMIVSNALAKLALPLGLALWLLAIALHVMFLVTFLRNRFRDWKLHHMVPSWFVPPVGIAVAGVSYAGAHEGFFYGVAQLCVWFAIAGYAILLPLMFYRLIFEDLIPDASKPTIAILAAPASLCLAAYLNVSDDPVSLVILSFYGIALLMTFTVYAAFVKLLSLPFSPGYAAFTFPMAIGATAQFKVAEQMEIWGARDSVLAEIRFIADLELVLATLVIAYVALRYGLYYLRRQEMPEA
ncbi:MAG: TDT family transporter [Mangrovicoccus sp.]|nr:TDT family transporter [Mangrovicoccus sp.]